MMKSVVAILFAAMVVTINGQGMFSSLMGSGMGAGMPSPLTGGTAMAMNGQMPLPLRPNQTQQLWQQFFFYRIMFGDAAARLIMADRLANMLGGNPFMRYYAGEYFDTPDAWWITSSLMNRQNPTPVNPVPTNPSSSTGTI